MEEAIPGSFSRADKRDQRVSYLDEISSPADVRKLDAAQLKDLAQEIYEREGALVVTGRRR